VNGPNKLTVSALRHISLDLLYSLTYNFWYLLFTLQCCISACVCQLWDDWWKVGSMQSWYNWGSNLVVAKGPEGRYKNWQGLHVSWARIKPVVSQIQVYSVMTITMWSVICY